VIVARGLHLFATTTPEQMLELGQMAGVIEVQGQAWRQQNELLWPVSS
jgi:hypothetical protein